MKLSFDIKKNFKSFSLNLNYTSVGDRTGVFGPSGSGKSTLVNLLAGLEHPDSGFIRLNGEMLYDSSSHINVSPENRRIGIVFQNAHIFPHLSVKNNLLYGFKRCAPALRRIMPEEIIEVLQLGSLLKRGVANLSGGEKQRVAIGRAVLSSPSLLIMDEPLSGLDDELKFQIIPFLTKTCEMFSIPYIFISHSLLEMRIMTDHVLSIVNGGVAGKISAEELAIGHLKKSSGYVNLLKLRNPRKINGLYAYEWGDAELYISDGNREYESLFQILSTDIILFKRHPEAVSARNLLKCRVENIFQSGSRIGVKLDYNGKSIIAEIVKEAVEELNVRKDTEIYAAMKAVAFKRLL